MPLFSAQNEYAGVNAHFQSYCQAENDWESFHGQLIASLVMQLSSTLPSGYRLRPERSLQIREFHLDTGESILSRHKPDIAFFDLQKGVAGTSLAFAPAPTAIIPLQTTLPPDPESYLRGITIYEIIPHQIHGTPITQIEILSPTNKPPNAGYLQYIYKRDKLLQAGINLVEVDFLHETDSPLENIPLYPHLAPFYIAISLPSPSFADGQTAIYDFPIDEPIPILQIPLKGQDYLKVDFEAAYNMTFEVLACGDLVDYDNLPAHFERYSPDDQAKIRAVMARVQSSA